MMWPWFVQAEQVTPINQLLQGLLAALAAYFTTGLQWPPQASVADGDTFDFVVVGAGTAGSIVANRLSENPDVSVLLIEAGGDPPIQSMLPGLSNLIGGTKHAWNYEAIDDGVTSQCQKSKKANVVRGKMLGGSSSMNSMQYVRGSPDDFSSWAVYDKGWEYQNILKYFIKSESVRDKDLLNAPSSKFRGTKGPLGITRLANRSITSKYLAAFHELGYKRDYDYNSGLQFGYSDAQFNIADGLRQSTATSYLAPIADRPNLSILKDTLVTKVIFDAELHAVGVEAISEIGTTFIVKANKEIILSAGSINTPKILMQSGVGNKEQLEKHNINSIIDLPIGENLQDHALVPLLFTGEKGPALPDPTTINDYFLPLLMGFVALNESSKRPDYQLCAFPIVSGSKNALMACTALGYRDDICNRFNDAIKGQSLLLANLMLLHPYSRGNVRLQSQDPKDPPLINYSYYSNRNDLERHVTYIEDLLKIFNTTYFKSIDSKIVDLNIPECANEEFNSREYWRCYILNMVSTSWHPVGTTSMGPVLDGQLRLLNASGLRVVDGGAMPFLTSGNTNAPIAMMAERAADLIKLDHGMTEC